MKTCPFCCKSPTIEDTTATCQECGISVPLDKWEGQNDVIHEINGIEWYTDGHKIEPYDESERLPYVLLRSNLESVMAGEWVDATPDGYFKSSAALVHRYRTADAVVHIDAKFEEEYSLNYMTMHAKPMGEGYVLRYSADGAPILYVMSLRPDIQEVK